MASPARRELLSRSPDQPPRLQGVPTDTANAPLLTDTEFDILYKMDIRGMSRRVIGREKGFSTAWVKATESAARRNLIKIGLTGKVEGPPESHIFPGSSSSTDKKKIDNTPRPPINNTAHEPSEGERRFAEEQALLERSPESYVQQLQLTTPEARTLFHYLDGLLSKGVTYDEISAHTSLTHDDIRRMMGIATVIVSPTRLPRSQATSVTSSATSEIERPDLSGFSAPERKILEAHLAGMEPKDILRKYKGSGLSLAAINSIIARFENSPKS